MAIELLEVNLGLKGEPGLSAYEVWKNMAGNGNKTKEQFIESLRGAGITNATVDEDGYMVLEYGDGKETKTPLQPIIEAGKMRDEAQASAQAAAQSANESASSASSAQASAQGASTSAGTAVTAAQEATAASQSANESKMSATSSATYAETCSTNAQNAADTATQAAQEASEAATSAQESAKNIESAEANAAQSATNAKASEINAKASEDSVALNADRAEESANAAKESETNAAQSEQNALQYRDEIQANVDAVDEAVEAAQQSEANAKQSETNAANSAEQAANSAASIEGDVEQAQASAEAAQTSAQNAENSAQAAKASETNAASSESSVQANATKAENAAKQAEQSATDARSSATAASQSASSAKQDAEEIATSIAMAIDKASEATNSATNASASASQAKTSETNAASSASNASASEQKAKEYADKVQEVVDGLSSAYTYMGSVDTYDELPTEGQLKGWMYNITKADKANQIKAGDNVVWNGESWDNLSGYVDLTDYAKKTELPTKTSELTNDSGYITAADDITGNASTATNVEWDGVTGKPSTYPPGSHKHSAGDVTGLSAVATTGSYNDLTDKPEQLPDNVVTWDFGTDNAINGVILNNGTISFSPLPEGPTTGIDVGGRIISNVYNATKANDAVNKSQLDKKFDRDDVTDTATANKVLRLDSNSKLPADITGNAATATTANAVAWDNVSGKPSAFTPASHTHDASTIAGLSEVATSGNYNDLIGTPTILTQTQVQGWINSAINNITNGDEVEY